MVGFCHMIVVRGIVNVSATTGRDEFFTAFICHFDYFWPDRIFLAMSSVEEIIHIQTKTSTGDKITNINK